MAMPKCLSGKTPQTAYSMYRFMSKIGPHRRCICPLELCSIFKVFAREKMVAMQGLVFISPALAQLGFQGLGAAQSQ